MIKIYTLSEKADDISFNPGPDMVMENIGKEGYYTLISVEEKAPGNTDGDEFAGLAQFYVDMTARGMYIAKLIYVYVDRKYRLQDVGYKLVHKVSEILKEHEVDVIAVNIPYDEKGEVLSDISVQEIEIFFRECGFISDVYVNAGSDKTLKLSDADGAHIALLTSKKRATICNISVPENRRRQGVAKKLLLAAERILLLKEIDEIYVDFFDGQEGLTELFQSAGYVPGPSVDILAIPMGVVLYSGSTRASLGLKNENLNYHSLSDLTIAQIDVLLDFLNKSGIRVSCYDIAHYNGEVSTVVYDKEGAPVSAILCSEQERDLHVNLLFSKAGVSPTYNLVAMYGMVKALGQTGGEYRYNRLTMTAYNSVISSLINKVFPDDNGLKTIGKCICMSKKLKKDGQQKGEFSYLKTEEDNPESEWKREIRYIPYQKNIVLKAAWHRDKDI